MPDIIDLSCLYKDTGKKMFFAIMFSIFDKKNHGSKCIFSKLFHYNPDGLQPGEITMPEGSATEETRTNTAVIYFMFYDRYF